MSAPATAAVDVREQLHFVDGEFRPGRLGRSFETLAPTTNQPICEVAEGTAEDVDDAVRAARRAFDEGPWPRMAAKERGAVLRRVADALRANATDLVALECLDIGMPIAQMGALAARAAENFDYFAAAIERLAGDAYAGRRRVPQLHRAQAGRRRRADHALERAADALDVEDRARARRRQHLRAQAGRVVAADRDAARGARLPRRVLPPGVFNVVHGFGETRRRAARRASGRRPDLASPASRRPAGRSSRNGAATLKRYSMELGGKSPVVVFADADLERAVDAVVRADLLDERPALHRRLAAPGRARRSTRSSSRRSPSARGRSASATRSTRAPSSAR